MNIPLPEQKGPHLINRWRTVRMAHFSTHFDDAGGPLGRKGVAGDDFSGKAWFGLSFLGTFNDIQCSFSQ